MRVSILLIALVLCACTEDRDSAERSRQQAHDASKAYAERVSRSQVTHAVQGAATGLVEPALEQMNAESQQRYKAWLERQQTTRYSVPPIDVVNDRTEFSRSALAELKRPGTLWRCVSGVVMKVVVQNGSSTFEQVIHDGRTLVCPRSAGVYEAHRN